MAKQSKRKSAASDWLCTHSSTSSGFLALEVLDRLVAEGVITLDDVKKHVAAYEEENK